MSSTVSQWADQLLMKKTGVDLQTFPQGALYIVGLPIGNAGDITLRALWILSIADVVAAEDTRETKKLLDRYGIDVPTVSVREHNEVAQVNMIIERLKKGERVALVTDAGTPAISDPGEELVRQCVEAGVEVTSLPGAAACITVSALIHALFPSFAFLFFSAALSSASAAFSAAAINSSPSVRRVSFAFLNSCDALPRARATSGMRLEPNRSSITTMMSNISENPSDIFFSFENYLLM